MMVDKVSEQLIDIRERWRCARHPFYGRLEEGVFDITHLGEDVGQTPV